MKQTFSYHNFKIPQPILFILLFLLPFSATSQTRRYLKSHEYMEYLERQDEHLAEKRAKLEAIIQDTYRSVKVPPNPVIPVIFHVFYSNKKERISKEQIYAQLAALNRDFGIGKNDFSHPSMEKEGFNAVSNQIGLAFCLPEFSKDSSAINYYPMARTDWTFDNAAKDPSQKGIAPWNPKQFLNIYVVDIADDLFVSGYAQMPGAADSTDAIIIDYRFLSMESNRKTPFNLGRTLVHLVGNWLGVYSIWGAGNCNKDGDFVIDTPHHNAPNFGCPPYKHLSTCYTKGLVTEMTMNLMDNTDDKCMGIFTTGQKYRLFAHLQASRRELLNHNYACNIKTPEVTPLAKISNTPTLFSGQVKVYPNPGRDYVQLSFSLLETEPIQISITDLTGRLLLEQKEVASTSQLKITTSDWATGLYLLSVRQNGKTIHSEKIVINGNGN